MMTKEKEKMLDDNNEFLKLRNETTNGLAWAGWK